MNVIIYFLSYFFLPLILKKRNCFRFAFMTIVCYLLNIYIYAIYLFNLFMFNVSLMNDGIGNRCMKSADFRFQQKTFHFFY